MLNTGCFTGRDVDELSVFADPNTNRESIPHEEFNAKFYTCWNQTETLTPFFSRSKN